MFGRIRKLLAGKSVIIPTADQLRDDLRNDLRPTEDWAVGDLAECIHDGDWYKGGIIPGPGPRFAETMVVKCVRSTGEFYGLNFANYPGFYLANAFRKITPRADAAERSESSFHDLIRRKSAPQQKPQSLPPARKPQRESV